MIHNILDENKLELIKKYSIPLAFGSIIIFLYLTIKKDAPDYRIVTVLIITFVFLAYFIFKRNHSKEFKSLGEIQEGINELFKNHKNEDKIIQTFVNNNVIAGELDLLYEVINEYKGDTHLPNVTRIFVISDCWDINFAEHSQEIGRTTYQNLTNIFITAKTNIDILSIIPSITIVGKNSIISFPLSKHNNINKNFPQSLTKENSSSATTGFKIGNEVFSDKYSNFFDNAQTINLDDIKKQFFISDFDKIKYYYAVIFSIAKELISNELLASNILYMGLLGSMAKYINRYNKKTIDNTNNISFNDLDFLIVMKEHTNESHEKIIKIAKKVSKRFSIEGVVDFTTTTEAIPIKNGLSNSTYLNLPIQLLFSEPNSFNRWDKFIATDRRHKDNHISFTWVKNKNKKISENKDLQDLLQVKDFSLIDFLEGVYGLKSCINILKDSSLFFYEWVSTNGLLMQEKKDLKLHGVNKKDFVKYSIKWCTLNFINASDSPFVDKKFYEVDVIRALKKINDLYSHIEIDKILNIYNEKSHAITDAEIKLVITLLEQYEKEINDYLN